MKCAFCSKDLSKGAGYLFSKKDGTTYMFCSSKCRNNQLGLKRVGKKAPWVKREKPASETKKEKAKIKPEKKPEKK
ncbi:50S ribosomal protein L24e [Candidatus Micrarchaeota archaeon]|nr:50S ribosomal protein L24e [Candidatus Micrarchaeota archaeon]MBD3417437.1 50S ribosomal protein L24e [Candidatus Micrarchaeota archaeon]